MIKPEVKPSDLRRLQYRASRPFEEQIDVQKIGLGVTSHGLLYAVLSLYSDVAGREQSRSQR